MCLRSMLAGGVWGDSCDELRDFASGETDHSRKEPMEAFAQLCSVFVLSQEDPKFNLEDIAPYEMVFIITSILPEE